MELDYDWGNSNLYINKPIKKGWCWPIGGHVPYPTDSPTAIKPGLFSSLVLYGSVVWREEMVLGTWPDTVQCGMRPCWIWHNPWWHIWVCYRGAMGCCRDQPWIQAPQWSYILCDTVTLWIVTPVLSVPASWDVDSGYVCCGCLIKLSIAIWWEDYHVFYATECSVLCSKT